MKTEISRENFIYALQLDNSLIVYQVYDYYAFQLSITSPYVLNHTIVQRWQQNFLNATGGRKINDFDIYNGKYLILFTGTNQTLVYEIDMQIYFSYLMSLPLFPDFEDSVYYSSSGNIVRSIYDGFLAVLMANKTDYQLFFYNF